MSKSRSLIFLQFHQLVIFDHTVVSLPIAATFTWISQLLGLLYLIVNVTMMVYQSQYQVCMHIYMVIIHMCINQGRGYLEYGIRIMVPFVQDFPGVQYFLGMIAQINRIWSKTVLLYCILREQCRSTQYGQKSRVAPSESNDSLLLMSTGFSGKINDLRSQRAYYAYCYILLSHDFIIIKPIRPLLFFFLLVWPPRFQSLLIMGWCSSIPEHRL